MSTVNAIRLSIPPRRPTPNYFQRFRRLVLQSGRLNTGNFTDIFAQVYGDRPVFYLDRNLCFSFMGRIAGAGLKPAPTNEVNYRQLAEVTSRIGNGLLSLGVKPGDRVGLMTYNRVELVFCEFACWKIGAIPVPLNFMLRDEEIRYQMENSGAELMIVDRKVFTENIKDPAKVPCIKQWIVVSEGEAPPAGTLSLEDLADRASPELTPYQAKSPDEIVIIFYTSGTTGQPRGAMLTHQAMMATLRTYSMLLALIPTNSKQLALLVMPVAHTSGHQNLLILVSMAIPMLFVSRFDPKEICRLIQDYRATFFAGIPAMFKMMLKAGAKDFDLSSMQVWGGGADAFANDLVNTFREFGGWKILGLRIKSLFVRGYGTAETSGHVCISPPWPVGPNCAGWVVPYLQYRLVNEQGEDVKKGERGELCLKGRTIMTGYWNDPQKTEASFLAGGWFRTGDIMYQGPWGLLYFVDREKDVIKVSGYSVFPTEVEQHLAQHPALDRVVVIGIKDEIKGQLPVALAVPRVGAKVTPEEVLAWAREHIAPYKCPRQVVFVNDIPTTFSLKPKRNEVREKFQHLFKPRE